MTRGARAAPFQRVCSRASGVAAGPCGRKLMFLTTRAWKSPRQRARILLRASRLLARSPISPRRTWCGREAQVAGSHLDHAMTDAEAAKHVLLPDLTMLSISAS